MSDSTLPVSEPNSTSTLLDKPGVLVAKKHHLLVRWSHWLNLPILLGLIVSGISIYWASPSISTNQIRIRETSMWRRILESGCAATCTRTTSLQQSTRLALQPLEPRVGHVGGSSAPALVVRVLIDAEWHGVPCRTVHGRRLALPAAPPDRSV